MEDKALLFEKFQVKFLLDNKRNQRELTKIKLTKKYFQKQGQISIILQTINPNDIPKIYKLKKRKNKGIPSSNKDIPKRGDVSNSAGTRTIKTLIKAVNISEVIISLIFIGAINKLVKFLLQISSKNNILKPILVLNKKS